MNAAEFENLLKHYAVGEAPTLGWGKRPALLIVDFIEGFTNQKSPLAGCWDREIEATRKLLNEVRKAGWPVFFTTVGYDPQEEVLLARKAPRVKLLQKGSRWVLIDHRLAPTDQEVVVSKRQGSAFFETDLAQELRQRGVDTVVICGCVTSGCVRASAVDAAQHGFRPLVVRECVADRSPLAQETNLIDIEQRYGDIISSADVSRICSGNAQGGQN